MQHPPHGDQRRTTETKHRWNAHRTQPRPLNRCACRWAASTTHHRWTRSWFLCRLRGKTSRWMAHWAHPTQVAIVRWQRFVSAAHRPPVIAHPVADQPCRKSLQDIQIAMFYEFWMRKSRVPTAGGRKSRTFHRDARRVTWKRLADNEDPRETTTSPASHHVASKERVQWSQKCTNRQQGSAATVCRRRANI